MEKLSLTLLQEYVSIIICTLELVYEMFDL